jgi:hypothetical protein
MAAVAARAPSPSDAGVRASLRTIPHRVLVLAKRRAMRNDSAMPAPRSRLRRLLFRLVLVAVVVELLSYGALFAAKQAGIGYTPILPDSITSAQQESLGRLLAGDTQYLRHDAVLGWSLRAGGGSREGIYQANAEGVRAARTYGEQPADGVLRLLCVGDSFTHCDEVANAETWQSRLEAKAPAIEVLNGGVPGFGPDQALLRLRELQPRFHPHVAVMGFMSENLSRVVNVFRPFYDPGTGIPLGKPRFRPGPAGLELLPNPCATPRDLERLVAGDAALFRAMGEHDYWYGVMPHAGAEDALAAVCFGKLVRYAIGRRLSTTSLVDAEGAYRTGTEALETAVGILDAFARESSAAGVLPVVVLFPSVKDLQRGVRTYGELVARLQQQKQRFVDLYEAFPAAQKRGAGLPGGHYSAAQNECVAAALDEYLAGAGLTTPAAVRAELERNK